ncbi:hypothetical protein K2X89_04310 [Myxococcota bacterium]|nr:hypothetical protein [Myxococcota bacterium]
MGKATMLHPDYPVVEGRVQMTREWSVELPQRFNRRIDDGSLVLWRPGLTIWTNIWQLGIETREAQRAWVKSQCIEGPADVPVTDLEVEDRSGALRSSCRVDERSDDGRRPALYCFAVDGQSRVEMAVYFDDEADLAEARSICASLAVEPVKGPGAEDELHRE